MIFTEKNGKIGISFEPKDWKNGVADKGLEVLRQLSKEKKGFYNPNARVWVVDADMKDRLTFKPDEKMDVSNTNAEEFLKQFGDENE